MIQETNIKREAFIIEITEFLRKVLPNDKSYQQVFPKIESSEQTPSGQTPQRRLEFPSTSYTKDVTYGEIASPFLIPDTRWLDTLYGIWKDGDKNKIGNSTVTVDNMSNISIKVKQFKGTEDFWKLVTSKM